jgi:hypothetical protein
LDAETKNPEKPGKTGINRENPEKTKTRMETNTLELKDAYLVVAKAGFVWVG